jgi:steroid delta-isomerase-like uncharacterized protein
MSRATDVAEQFLAAWSKDDPGGLLALCSDDCVYEDVTVAAVSRSHKELRDFFTMFRTALPDMTFTSEGVTACDKGVTVEWTVTGTHTGDVPGLPPATNKAAEVRGVSVIDLDANGLIRGCRDYWDAATWFRQIGLME